MKYKIHYTKKVKQKLKERFGFKYIRKQETRYLLNRLIDQKKDRKYGLEYIDVGRVRYVIKIEGELIVAITAKHVTEIL